MTKSYFETYHTVPWTCTASSLTRKSSFLKFAVGNLGCTVMFASKETLYPEQKLDETVKLRNVSLFCVTVSACCSAGERAAPACQKYESFCISILKVVCKWKVRVLRMLV